MGVFSLGSEVVEDEEGAKGEYTLEEPSAELHPVPAVCEPFVERNKDKWIYGRLGTRSALSFWRNTLRASSVVLLWLTIGFHLPWASELRPQGEFPNHKGTTGVSKFGSNEKFVDSAVNALVGNGAVVECDRSFLELVSPLNVVEQRDKLRLIHDLKHLNQFLVWPKFKYESLAGLCDILSPGDYMVSVDLQSAYHHVALEEDAWRYMGFYWKEKYYYFRVLPFGLGPAPYVFTKVFKPLVEHWRAQGIRTLPYLDDHLFGGRLDVPQTDSRSILWVREQIMRDLCNAGWLISATKVKLTPTQVIVHLGMVICTRSGVFRVPKSRMKRLVESVHEVLKSGKVRTKQLSRIAGQIQSFALAMGPVVAFYTRYMYFSIEDRTTWWQFVRVTGFLERELRFWAGVSIKDYMCPIWPQVFKWSIKINSDAGERGWGAALQTPTEVAEARGYMNMWERAQSSTWRELFAILQTLKSFMHLLANCRVLQWCCDNQGAVFDMGRGGSRVAEIHKLCVQIFEICESMNLRVLWTWVPREEHDARWADALSKVFDKDDWMLHRGAFNVCESLWGVHTVDRFASDRNHLCERFNSYYWCPGTGGVDALAQTDWLIENNWCNPPFWMIGRVVAFLREARASATVIVPHWPGQPWWAMLCPDGLHWATFVVDWIELEGSHLLFSSGHHSGNTRGCVMPGYRFFALKVSFREDECETWATRCLSPFDCNCGYAPKRVIRARVWLNA